MLWRRHLENCKHRKKGIRHTACNCPVWCDGTIDGRRVRHSMKTTSWDKAAREIERGLDPEPSPVAGITVARASDGYLADCVARNLEPSTVRSYTKLMQHFAAFCEAQAYTSLAHLTVDALGQFRASRRGKDGTSPVTPRTQRKEIEALRAFCSFCVDRSWMEHNLAKKLKPPREDDVATLPFSRDEVDRILNACDQLENNNRDSAAFGRRRAKALVLLLLYSGLRISDAAKLRRSALDSKSGRLLLRMMKTRSPLYVKLAPDAIDSLNAIGSAGEHFFWNAGSSIETTKGSLRRTLVAVGNATKTKDLPRINVHPHRFRDTFAIRLLEEDVPIRTVQLLLGHKSVLTTERHYAHFLSSQQRLLDAAVDKLDFSPVRTPA